MLMEARLLDERREGKAEGRIEGKAEKKCNCYAHAG